MKILLTGATGSLGRVFLENLGPKSHEIFTLGRKSPTVRTPLRHLYFDFQKDFRLALDWEPDCIVHLAGLPAAEGNCSEEYFLANAKSVETLVDFAERKKVKKFIFSSSGSVYGGGEDLRESSPLRGESFYALSKMEGEKTLLEFSGQALIFRIASVYGKNTKSFIGKLLKLGKRGFFPYPSSGKIKRSFIHINDVSAILEKSLELNTTGVYNLSHPETWVYADLIQIVADALIRNGYRKPVNIPIPEIVLTIEKKIRSFQGKPSLLKALFETSTLNVDKLVQEVGTPNLRLAKGLEELGDI